MFKSIRRQLVALVAALITVVAMSGVSSACTWGLFEPEIPESLRKEL
ncbi:cyclic lactone autoinducer peptide [Marinisporobacter balticus]|uniref:Cyclic lactone autoinducer peptide n=1 Tax=Marinisporobacter balticus TaxID=2018667 RepID=A0A4R2KAD4_9FIRM|nr:cyclic lactone autoinducer peptide [Marinisporobacter balticus]TCO70403.1 cyclic lactone autoinducer peptide [Marinisporobacter balticus]